MQENKKKHKKVKAILMSLLIGFTFFTVLPIPVVMYMKWWSLIYNLFF